MYVESKSVEWHLIRINTTRLLVLTALVYYLYSRISDGFYQHDEVAHFINKREFWHEDTVGFTLLVPPRVR